MIVVLCRSFEDAKEAFSSFMQYLLEYEPWSILNFWNDCYCVETDENLRYIFVDYRMEHVFDNCRPDIVLEGDFFAGIGEWFYHKFIKRRR